MQGDGDQVEEEGAQRASVLCFAGHTLDLANRELRRGGERIDLGSRYFNALVLLASEPGALVSKDRFMDEVWRGIPVTDEALTQCIRTLRRALGDEAGAPRFIETVPKHGYRFVAEVAEAGPRPFEAPLSEARASRLAGASTIGGGVAGFLGGLFYGIAGTQDGGGTIPVLVALGAALGVLGGAGVGLGMALARAWQPGPAWPPIAGAAAGGMLVGALGQVLSLDGVAVLTGAALGRVTGLFEGLVLGLAAGLATVMVLRAREPGHEVRRIGLAGLVGGVAGLLVALAGGRLFGASLLELQARLPSSGLAIERVGRFAGEAGFGPATQLATATLEAATFVACVAAANLLLRRR